MNAILAVFRKEWREVMRDRRVVVGAFLMPVVLVLFMVMLFGSLNRSVERAQERVRIGVVNQGGPNPILDALSKARQLRLTVYASSEAAQTALKEGNVATVLTFPTGFSEALVNGGAEIRANFDSRNPRSAIGLSVAREVVTALNQASVRARFVTLNLSGDLAEPVRLVPQDTAERAAAAMGLVGMLPYLIVMWAFYGGVGSAADLVAGEKERGTLETLLTAPVPRSAVVWGKYLALALVCAVSSLASILGVILGGVLRLPGSQELATLAAQVGPGALLAMCAVVMSLVLWFAAALLAISAWAKTMREAQTYLTVIGFIVIMPAVLSQIISFTELGGSPVVPWVPILNSALALRDGLLGQLTLAHWTIPVLQNLALGMVALVGVDRLFRRESILRRN